MVRRLLFVGVLPLTSENSTTRGYIGVAAAFASTIYFRETLPFRGGGANFIATLAQYQVCSSFTIDESSSLTH